MNVCEIAIHSKWGEGLLGLGRRIYSLLRPRIPWASSLPASSSIFLENWTAIDWSLCAPLFFLSWTCVARSPEVGLTKLPRPCRIRFFLLHKPSHITLTAAAIHRHTSFTLSPRYCHTARAPPRCHDYTVLTPVVHHQYTAFTLRTRHPYTALTPLAHL